MKQLLRVVPSCLALLTLSACSVTGSSTEDNNPFGNKPTPEFSEQALSGKVFGADWKAKVAVIKPFGNDGKEVSLDVLSDSPAVPCKAVYSSNPYATVVIPANYAVGDYSLNLGEGNPLVFTGFAGSVKNVIADAGRLRISTIADSGFLAYLYAKGTEGDGTVSEINGKIQVIDCRKVVDFSVWDEFLGWHDLVELDGKSLSPLSGSGRIENSNFYSRTRSAYVRSAVIPLYYSASSSGSSASYNLGALEGLGSTSVSEINGVKTINYSFHGPITFKGLDITMNLDMTVVRSGSTVKVSYTLEVPGQITKTSHSFALRK